MTSSATYPLRDERGPMLKAIALGLGAGIVLAAPLHLLLEGASVGANHQLVNPFSNWTGAGAKQVVILGTDVGGGNTDVMYTLRVKDGVTELIQVPRDTYIASKRYGALKANALLAYGGPELVKQELSRQFGRPVEHHILINLSVIRRLGDSLGGLEVDVPQRMLYNDNTQNLHIDLQPGRQVLRGKDIEGFLRFRHDGLGDIGRLDRQRLLLRALFDQITKPESLVRLPSLLTAAGKAAAAAAPATARPSATRSTSDPGRPPAPPPETATTTAAPPPPGAGSATTAAATTNCRPPRPRR
jgi:LCP family protein required for cell wall assembly